MGILERETFDTMGFFEQGGFFLRQLLVAVGEGARIVVCQYLV